MSRHAREKNPEIRPSCELPLFEQNFYKFEQTKSCLTAPLSANGESGDCLSGPQPPCSPRDVARARMTDRETSHAAARSISLENLGRTRNAILRLLKAFPSGLTDEQLIETYREAQAVSPQNFWNATDSGIRSRRADLVRWGFVCEAGMGETKSKRACTIWKLK